MSHRIRACNVDVRKGVFVFKKIRNGIRENDYKIKDELTFVCHNNFRHRHRDRWVYT